MLFPFSFTRFYRANRFAEALGCLPNGKSHRRHDELWACYRLGLYATVADSPMVDSHWKGTFASAVSLAACGRDREAADIVRWMVMRYRRRKNFSFFAEALAPYLPDIALEILDRVVAPSALRAALLLRNGKHRESEILLHEALRRREERFNPELHLYMSNVEERSNQKKLVRLNAFLAASALSPLTLIESCQPPSPSNLISAIDLPLIEGPMVSILMTAYQSGKHIGRAISSVLRQTWRNIELIIVDDASSDNTIDEWCSQDSRIRYVRLPVNVGTYVAKNIGLQYASGEFVTCHDSDDWSHPLKIERQVTPLLKNRNLVCTVSNWVRIQNDGIYYAQPVHPLSRLNPSSPLFRRKQVFDVAGAWDSVRTGADSEFIARLKLVFGRKAVLKIRQPLAFGLHRPGSLMTSLETGYSSTGISPSRLAYREAWTYWHIDALRAGIKPRMPGVMAERVFPAPSAITVLPVRIARNLVEVERNFI